MQTDPARSRDIGAVSTEVPVRVTRREERQPVAPFSEHTFKIQFTARRALRDKLREAQDLLRHRVPDGALAAVFEKALDALIVNLKKERFAVGRKPRNNAAPAPLSAAWSRNIPDPMKRAVYERAQGRCEFVAEDGRRCTETASLEFDHVDGFARTHLHSVDGIRLVCRGHNVHAAEQLYGRVFMDRVRRERQETAAIARTVAVGTALPPVARPGASAQQALF